MIGLTRFVQVATQPLGVALIGFTATVAAYNVGLAIGHDRGTEQAEAEQRAANAEQAAQIRERVRDALDEAGADHSDANVDRLLRGLAGGP